MAMASTFETLVGNHSDYYRNLSTTTQVSRQCMQMITIASLCFATYGAIIGMSHSGLMAVASAIKLPILFMLTLLITFPTFYVLNMYMGAKLSFARQLTLFVSTLSLTGIILMAFAPVSLFFLWSISHYETFKIINIVIFLFSGFLGARFLWRGALQMSSGDPQSIRRVAAIWVVLYGLVGSQMAWMLRPFFGAPTLPFEWLRDQGGGFFVNVLGTFTAMF